MGKLNATYLVPLTIILFSLAYWFRPGGIEGPRIEAVTVEGKGFEHSVLTEVLTQVVGEDGTVDYGALRREPELLNRYLGQLRTISPANAPHRFKTNADRLAYYINAYNAFVLAGVRDLCPIEDLEAVYMGGGFFWRTSFLMGQEPITLSALEAERIRGVLERRPSVHLALVKGAKGYLPLSRRAYEGHDVNARLNALGASVIKLPHMVQRSGNVLKLNRLFEWYQTDFVDLEAWLRKFDTLLVEGKPRIEYMPFDSGLNGTCQ